MQSKHNPDLISLARNLRKNMTREERHLWYDFLREYPVRFMRQKIIGRYIADFYCSKAKIVVELDGSQHFEDEAKIRDSERTAFIESYGIKVLRIPNIEVTRNFRAVCDYIDQEVRKTLSQLRCQLPLKKGADTASPFQGEVAEGRRG